MVHIALQRSLQVPQLFYKHENGKLVLVVAKIVDDIKAGGEGDGTWAFIDEFDERFMLGTVSYGPGKTKFLGISINQSGEMTIFTGAADKLSDLTKYSINSSCLKQSDQTLNKIKGAFFASTDSSLGWNGTAVSLFCSFQTSYLQQKIPDTKVSHLIEQQNILRKLEKHGTMINCTCPADSSEHHLSALAFF